MRPLSFALSLLLAPGAAMLTNPARADFRLQPGTPTPDAAAQAPAPDAGDAASTEDGAEKPEKPQAPRFKLARGFGQGVPLAFAARQIVPKAVSVKFGDDVDRDAPVDWSGGQPWNRVLAAAVKPLGLHLTTGTLSVLISR